MLGAGGRTLAAGRPRQNIAPGSGFARSTSTEVIAMIPVTVTFHGMRQSDRIEADIVRRARRLDRCSDRIEDVQLRHGTIVCRGHL